MVTTCAVCVAIDRNPAGNLLPTTSNYRGFSMCREHLHLWEANKEADWDEIVRLAKPNLIEVDIASKDGVTFYAEVEPEVLKVEMPDDTTPDEKMEILEEAVEEFNGLTATEIATALPTEEELHQMVDILEAKPKPKSKKRKRGRPKGKGKKGAKK